MVVDTSTEKDGIEITKLTVELYVHLKVNLLTVNSVSKLCLR